MWASRRRRGFTLVEMMVALFLLGLATTLMAGFFSFYTRQALRYSQREELLGNAEKGLARLQASLADSRAAEVVLDSTLGLYFPTAEPSQGQIVYDSNGALVWQAWLGFGRDASTNTLYEARQAFGIDTVDKPPSVAPALWSRRTLAWWVRDLTVTGPVDGAFSVRLTVRDNTNYQAEFVTTVRPQN